MFDFLFKSGKVEPDLSFIGVDMHSHLLPGLDDGLQDVNQSVEFISQLKQLGYKKLYCTPHILSDLYPNSPKTILPKLELLRNALQEAKVSMPIEAAAEYMIDYDFLQMLNEVKKEDLLTIKGEYILVEMSYLAPSPQVEESIFQLRILGLQPILAHPERYGYYHNQFEKYEHFRDLGCKLQLNILSLSGGYGPAVKKTALKLLEHNLIDFLGTDMHHTRHLEMLKKIATEKKFYTLTEQARLQNLDLL
jgi:protein-tyrosine phosphatase